MMTRMAASANNDAITAHRVSFDRVASFFFINSERPRSLLFVRGRERFGEVRRLELQRFLGGLTRFETRKISPHECVSQNIAHRRQNVGGGRAGGVSRKRNQRAELIAPKILKRRCHAANQRLPEEPQDIILL